MIRELILLNLHRLNLHRRQFIALEDMFEGRESESESVSSWLDVGGCRRFVVGGRWFVINIGGCT
jgi:hypothetical protein